MPEEPSKILCDADFSVCYDGAQRSHISGMGRTRSQKPKCTFQKGVPILMILVQNLILLRFVHNRAQPRVAMCLRVG